MNKNIKIGTIVRVLQGKDRGKNGEVIAINSKNKVKIKGINFVIKHTKRGREKMENWIQGSNVTNLRPKRLVAGLYLKSYRDEKSCIKVIEEIYSNNKAQEDPKLIPEVIRGLKPVIILQGYNLEWEKYNLNYKEYAIFEIVYGKSRRLTPKIKR